MKFAKSYLVLTALIVVSLSHDAMGAAVWLSDFSKAQAQAKAEGKFLLVNFTGSDWCGWCIKLRKDVFLRPEFSDYAKSNLVLLEIDFPKRKPLPPAVQLHNQKLAEQFQVQAYPTLVVLDVQGTKLGRISYGNGGPKLFIAEVEKLIRPQPETLPTRSPARKASKAPQQGKVSGTAETNRTELKLRGITGPKLHRRAVINDRAFSAGETMLIKLPARAVKVRCVEIRERSVIVTVNGGPARRELRLAAGA
jgi:thioredoxin-related protein